MKSTNIPRIKKGTSPLCICISTEGALPKHIEGSFAQF